MKSVVIQERAFEEAFKQAEYDINKAIHDTQTTLLVSSTSGRVSVTLECVQKALAKLKERLIES